jgi:hypothetical protein
MGVNGPIENCWQSASVSAKNFAGASCGQKIGPYVAIREGKEAISELFQAAAPKRTL